jgi:hypothetical protein
MTDDEWQSQAARSATFICHATRSERSFVIKATK